MSTKRLTRGSSRRDFIVAGALIVVSMASTRPATSGSSTSQAARSSPAQGPEAARLGRRATSGKGLSLFVRFGEETAQILRGSRVDAPFLVKDLGAPRLDSRTWTDYPTGTKEIVIALFGLNGAVKAVYAIPGRPLYFYDEAQNRSEPITKGSRKAATRSPARARRLRRSSGKNGPAFDDRRITIPLPEGAAFLGFLRAEIAPLGKRQKAQSLWKDPCRVPGRETLPARESPSGQRSVFVPKLLSLYDLRSKPDPGDPPSPPPLPPLDTPIRGLPPLRVRDACVWPFPDPRDLAKLICPAPAGDFDGTTVLAGSGGTSSSRFDIVILGDGFQISELAAFHTWADRYKTELLSHEPFASSSAKINIHEVRTSSTDSGVGSCPDSAPSARKTYYWVKGKCVDEYGTTGGAGYFCTQSICNVIDAVERVAPLHEVELIVMIVNCDVYGGKAEPDNSLVFVPGYTHLNQFERLALHESGHGIAAFGEEDVRCAPSDPLRFFPNIVHESSKNNAWWKSLATPSELDSAGDFLAHYVCPDCPPPSEHRLGLYWGAQWADTTGQSAPCHPDCLPDPVCPGCHPSCSFYRAEALCKMGRHTNEPFGRDCKEWLRLLINLAAP